MPKINKNDQLDVRCLQCDYELREITQPVYPECGWDYGNLKAMMDECGKPVVKMPAIYLFFAAHCSDVPFLM